MEIGISTIVASSTEFYPDLDMHRRLELVAEAGFTHIEYSDQSFPAFRDASDAEMRSVGERARSLGIRLWSAHCPCDHGVVYDPDPEKREAAMALMVRSLDGLAAAGVERMVLHQAATGLDDNTRVPPVTLDAVARLCEAGRERGVRILIENFVAYPTRLCVAICEELAADNLGIVLDTGHANHTPLDVADEIRVAGKWLESLHVHDNNGPEAGDQHMPPGYGTTDWPSVVRALGEAGYAGPFMLEVIPYHPPVKGLPAPEALRLCYEAARSVLRQSE